MKRNRKYWFIEVEKTDCTAPLTTPGSLTASMLLALEASPGNGRPVMLIVIAEHKSSSHVQDNCFKGPKVQSDGDAVSFCCESAPGLTA